MDKPDALKELQTLEGIGPKIALMLFKIGVRSVNDLKTANPQALYDKLCDHLGVKVDRCVLYVFRCAVYNASTPNPESELLKWWNWKERPVNKF